METLGLSPNAPKPAPRLKELFWPAIDDEVAAVTAARNAMYASLFIAAMTAAFGGFAGQGPWFLVDALVFAIAGIGIRQLSRASAIIAFLMYALAWIGAGGWSILRPVLLAILLGGIRAAAFAHHQRKEVRDAIANPPMDTTGMSRISIILEELPRRAWPAIHVPFLAILGLLVALNLFALNTLLFGSLYSISAGSMEPTICIGDRIFVLRPAFTGPVRRGDVVAVRYPVDPAQTFLKRVIGVPGDHLKIASKDLILNGKKVSEPYVIHSTEYIDPYRDNFPSEPNVNVSEDAAAMLRMNVKDGELVVPAGRYFVMGDNRDSSLDSRYWGYVVKDELLGRPVLVFGRGKREALRYPLGE